MRLLGGDRGSVLWLLDDSDDAAPACGRRGRARHRPERLVFAPRADLDRASGAPSPRRSVPRYFACHAHTTASDALWAGLPVSRLGETFAGRVAASLLASGGLPS